MTTLTPDITEPPTRSVRLHHGLFEAGPQNLKSGHDVLSFLKVRPSEPMRESPSALPCFELHLNPGSTLYQQGHVCKHAFLLQQGAVARLQSPDGKSSIQMTPNAVAISGAHDLIGLHLGLNQRPDSAIAITQAKLLVLPMLTLQAVSSSTTLINDLLMRTAGAALFRDWQVSYRLCDLSAWSRTVTGLCYLTQLAALDEANAPDGVIALSWPLSSLGLWLSLEMDVLRNHLAQLEQVGALSHSQGRIHWVNPLKLQALGAISL